MTHNNVFSLITINIFHSLASRQGCQKAHYINSHVCFGAKI